MTIGFSGVFAGVVVLLGRSILESQIAESLTSDAALQTTIRDVYVIASSILADVAGAVILGGVVLVAAAWFAGPARVARTSREAIAPFLRERPAASYAITLAVMALIFIWNPLPATGKPAGMIVFTLLALLGTGVLIRQTAQEFPDARPGAARLAISARWAKMRGRRQADGAPSAPAPATTADQLQQLADLRDRGEITSGEYQTAKARILHE
jgi:Short C-terminal domain